MQWHLITVPCRDVNETLRPETDISDFLSPRRERDRDLPKFSRDRDLWFRVRGRDRDVQDRHRDIFRDLRSKYKWTVCFSRLPRR